MPSLAGIHACSRPLYRLKHGAPQLCAADTCCQFLAPLPAIVYFCTQHGKEGGPSRGGHALRNPAE
eukprot:365091-Chlamydomonas_euryale.AAC.3